MNISIDINGDSHEVELDEQEIKEEAKELGRMHIRQGIGPLTKPDDLLGENPTKSDFGSIADDVVQRHNELDVRGEQVYEHVDVEPSDVITTPHLGHVLTRDALIDHDDANELITNAYLQGQQDVIEQERKLWEENHGFKTEIEKRDHPSLFNEDKDNGSKHTFKVGFDDGLNRTLMLALKLEVKPDETLGRCHLHSGTFQDYTDEGDLDSLVESLRKDIEFDFPGQMEKASLGRRIVEAAKKAVELAEQDEDTPYEG